MTHQIADADALSAGDLLDRFLDSLVRRLSSLATVAVDAADPSPSDEPHNDPLEHHLRVRERFWELHPETRLGTEELAAALNRSKSWIYSRTMQAATNPIPHRKLSGRLVFVAGDVRTWVRDHEKATRSAAEAVSEDHETASDASHAPDADLKQTSRP